MKIRKTILLAVLIVAAVILAWDVDTYAAITKTGTLNADGVNFRKGSGTGYESIGKLNKGDSGPISDEGKDDNGYVWYQMTINSKTGWVRSDYVDVEVEDAEFDQYLEEQGFPKSYHAALKSLHAKYPNWVFEAQQTGYTWAEAIAAESKVGINTVHNASAPDSWKSTAEGAYNWQTNEWIAFDSGGWVAASKSIVKYYMDPRNFLDDTYIFQFLKHSYDASSYTLAERKEIKNGLKKMVKDTFLEGDCDDESYVNVLMSVAKAQGVSPYTLASMILQEQGINGTGGSISGTEKGYKGYYNYFNVGAYAAEGLTAVQRGLRYAKNDGKAGSYGRPWNTREKAISGGAQIYAEQFVKVGQDTTYLKKFNVQGNFLHQYMTNVGGAASEGKLMARAYDENAREGKLVFKIPVFKSMPTKPASKPTKDLNPNNRLLSLSVKGHKMTPSFDFESTSYALTVENEVSKITIKATAVASTTTVSGAGAKALKVGKNIFKVTAKSESGSERVYTLTITRKEPPHTPGTAVFTPATMKADGSIVVPCAKCGESITKEVINKIDSVKLSYTSISYNGKTRKPTVVVKDSGGTQLTTDSYTVQYDADRIKVGRYKVTVTFKGNYTGQKTLYFTINPAKTTVEKVTPATKALKVKLVKKSPQVTGYEVQYSKSKSFKSPKIKTIKSYKTTSTTLSKLESNKTYYVRVRTYKTVSGVKYYSGWSGYKKAKVK